MILFRRTDERLLAAARRATGDVSLTDVERYRLRPWVGFGLGLVASVALVVGIATGAGWLVLVFSAALVAGWFADRHLTVVVGPDGAFVFRDSVWGPSIESDARRLQPGDVERIGTRRWRVAGHDLWILDPDGTLLERLSTVG